ncbi:hypothetical protein M595_6022 [Lyngbya aestuarii BL J]|uniref:Uncharacterized protein n=1 Tax=Lyngbya aestuarii BL J TaxID=1348334 RepID=U7Q885_9CYAN|nr:hypothetical protein [Lyngbya aestuarii]ERT04039.1 hypothetical protein M595_6022 [Lyngbya aestuarii BL J]
MRSPFLRRFAIACQVCGSILLRDRNFRDATRYGLRTREERSLCGKIWGLEGALGWTILVPRCWAIANFID